MNENLADRLKKALDLRNMKQTDLVDITGISKGAISQYLKGEYEPKQNNIFKISKALNINPAWLMGKDVEMEVVPNANNIIPLKTKKVPLLGTIAAGVPILAEQCFEDYVEYNGNSKVDYCIKVKGDSMINARIYDGDIVFIREQSDVEDGEIAAVLIDDEATLKRVFKMPGRIQLRAENPNIAPMDFTEEQGKYIRILGKAIAFQAIIK
jgi:repressor LexA